MSNFTEDEIEHADAASKERMAHAIASGEQREELKAGERVRVVEESWAFLMRRSEDCFHCKDHSFKKQHHDGIVEAHGQSNSPSFANGGY